MLITLNQLKMALKAVKDKLDGIMSRLQNVEAEIGDLESLLSEI